MRLKDKVAVITGASKGIGEAIALAFAREGATVVLAARSGDLLEQIAERIRALGFVALPVVTDVTDESSVAAMIKATHDAFGRIDILVNNAGMGSMRHIAHTSVQTWDTLIGVNLRGPFLCIKHVWKIMEAQGGGSIINVGSTSGSRAHALMAAYSASKWGLVGLTKSTAVEGAPLGIRVNIVNPGKVMAGLRQAIIKDREPILDVADVVGPILFLASDDARQVHGQVIEVDQAPARLASSRERRRVEAEP
jgi:NAD(P)-dependent dehydrogenase (short-subunit alcohol dehydrogenase family)